MINLDWTDERADQLTILTTLIHEIRALNSGSLFLENAKLCIGLSERLLRGNSGDLKINFLEFLHRICIKDRESRLKNG